MSFAATRALDRSPLGPAPIGPAGALGGGLVDPLHAALLAPMLPAPQVLHGDPSRPPGGGPGAGASPGGGSVGAGGLGPVGGISARLGAALAAASGSPGSAAGRATVPSGAGPVGAGGSVGSPGSAGGMGTQGAVFHRPGAGDYAGAGTGPTKIDDRNREIGLGTTQGDLDSGTWYDQDAAADRMDALKQAKEDGTLEANQEVVHEQGFAGKSSGDVFKDRVVGSGETDTQGAAYAGAYGEVYGHKVGYDGVEDWLAGEVASVGGSVSGTAGVGASGSANAATSGGAAGGRWNPETGEREGMCSAEAGVGASASVAASGRAQGEAYVEGLEAGAAGSAEAEVAARVEAEASAAAGVQAGTFTLAGAHASASGELEARAGAEASGEAAANAVEGVRAKGGASAEAMARAEGSASYGTAVLGVESTTSYSGTAEAGAGAGASGGVALGVGTLGAMGSAEAFAGARAAGSMSQSFGFGGVEFGSMSMEASVAAGAGAGAGGGIMFKNGILTVNLSMLVVAGVGGGLSGTLQFDLLAIPKVFLSALADGLRTSDQPHVMIPQLINYVIQGANGASFDEMSGAASEASSDAPTTNALQALPLAPARTPGGGGSSSGPAGPLPAGLSPAASLPRPVTTAAMAAPTAAAAPPTTTGIGQAVAQAGGRFDPVTGNIDMSSGSADPTALIGKLPGELGQQHDAKLGAVVRAAHQAHAMRQQAGVEGQNAVADAMAGLETALANPMQGLATMIQAGIAGVAGLVQQGLLQVGRVVSAIQAVAAQAIKEIAQQIAAAVAALLGVAPKPSGYAQKAAKADDDIAAARDRLTQEATGLKQNAFGGAGAMLKGLMAGVSKGFLGDAVGPIGAAVAKSNRAEAMLDQVDGKTHDLAGAKARVELDDRQRGSFAKVSAALGGLAGPGLDGVTAGLDAAATKTAGATQQATTQAVMAPVADARAQMAQLAKPKKKADAKVAAKEAEASKVSPAGGGSVGDRFKAAGQALKGIGGVFKSLFGKKNKG